MADTIAEKLQALADLQKIDSKLDRLRQIRGGLPEEVRELEDELAGLQIRVDRIQEELDVANMEIAKRRNHIKENEESIRKYDRQLNDVKNNREFEALNKEIELARLEIMTSERKILQYSAYLEERLQKHADLKALYGERQMDLEAKQNELKEIMAETEAEEERLKLESAVQAKKIEPRLLRAYLRIRNSMRNGLAVVTLYNEACGGCFVIVPPQQQNEIRQQKRVTTCENCGRILVSDAHFHSQEEAVAVAAQ